MVNTPTSPKAKSKKTNKISRVVQKGRLYITATFNNTLASITDDAGGVLCWTSTGEAGFSGSRKATPYAATVTIENVLNKARQFGLSELSVFIKGPGPARDVVLRVLRAQHIKLLALIDTTPDPHNGTRPRKAKHNK
ncbi:MAG TPA: 30S ribosomal protein S11 [Candidatus Woesebacteria bacterium]|jgi:small subunit ribosomal protein S11|nr:30S ribosomal protein S11 [Candidatus Woesebacteria bacterium]